jgi:lysozyme family protein
MPGIGPAARPARGQLKGTKYGILAASYPTLDIKNLPLEEAQAIYEKDFWEAAGSPDLPPRLAFAVFDAAVNNGTIRAVRWPQLAVGAAEDGIYGPATRVAVQRAIANDPDDLNLHAEVHARRIHFMVGLSGWSTYGLGWARRLAAIPAQGAHHWPA